MQRMLVNLVIPAIVIFILFLTPATVYAVSETVVQQQSITNSNYQESVAVSASRNEILGYTYYDLQANHGVNRQVEHRGTDWVHFSWMFSADTVENYPNRSIQYNAYELNACFYPIGGGGYSIGGAKAGFPSMDVFTPSHFPVIAGHESGVASFQTTAFYDYAYGVETDPMGLFTNESPTDMYGHYTSGQQGTGPDNPNLWPQIEVQFGTETVLHMVTRERGGYSNQLATISYYRRVGDYGVGNGVWSDQKVIDTNIFSYPDIIADPNSDKVAIAWIAPCEWYRPDDESTAFENDVYFAESSSQGADWVAATPGPSISREIELGTLIGSNISNYEKPDSYDEVEYAYNEVKGLYDQSSDLHIIWNTRRYYEESSSVYPYKRFGSIKHWSENDSYISTIYSTMYPSTIENDTCIFVGDDRQEAAYISIAECGNGNLYTVFTLFSPPAMFIGDSEVTYGSPCLYYDISSDTRNAVGYIHMSVSDDGGKFWDYPLQVTDNPYTPNGCSNCMCGFPQCHSEEYVSTARYSRTETCGELAGQDVLDIFYIDDLAPGPLSSNALMQNPVRWLVTPCREIVTYLECIHDNIYSPGLGLCYSSQPLFVHDGMPTTTFDYTFSNPGLSVIDYSLSVNYITGDNWVDMDITSGTLPAGGSTAEIEFTFSIPLGAPINSTWDCTIDITRIVADDTCIHSIPVCLQYAIIDPPQVESVATSCKRLAINNFGGSGLNTQGEGLNYLDDCDTFTYETYPYSYLFTGYPLVGRIEANDTLLFKGSSQNWLADDGFRPIAEMTVDSISDPTMMIAASEFVTADSSVGCILSYYAPSDPDTCEGIIQHFRFYNNTDATLNNVALGCFFDWDVPSDSGSDNTSSFSTSDNLIYQQGYEYDGLTSGDCGQYEDDRFAGVMPLGQTVKNAMTLDNATWVYSSGPFGLDAPLPAGPVYELMNGEEGFSLYSTGNPDSIATDLSTLITFGIYNILVSDTIEIYQVLATGKEGQSDFFDDMHNLVEWAGRWVDYSCCDMPGDANNDATFNIGDAVYLITYIFKGGPAPPCMDGADANNDCAVNIGDAVYQINCIFYGPCIVECGCVE